jgi:glycerophosphoryl diester phosphodiesterase
MKCIAHRGYSLKYKDNSIEGIREAIHREYDGVEIDVQLCGSGELVLYHDIYIEGRYISDLNIERVRELGICTLQDVYEQIPEIKQVLLILDIKGTDLGVVKTLVKFYEKESTENVLFCSFNRKIVYNLPNHFKVGSTFESTFHISEYPLITMGLNAVILHWTCLDHEFIHYCSTKDIKVYTYTHKEDEELEYMYRYRVDGIITNGF